MRILAFINPRAAGGKALRGRRALESAQAASPHEFIWHAPASAAELRDGIRGARSGGFDAVLLAGGDGTVHAALQALADEDMPFGVLPYGRGNDFVRNVGLSVDPREHVYSELAPRTLHVDLPAVNGAPYASIACLGLDAEVGLLANRGAGFLPGPAGYVVCVLRGVSRFEPLDVEVELDDSRWAGRAALVAVANGPCYGGGMKIAPNANPTDGVLDVCIVEDMPRVELVRRLPRVFQGAHGSDPAVTMLTSRSVSVQADGGCLIVADGEPAGRVPARWSIDRGALRVMLPESAIRNQFRGGRPSRLATSGP